VRVSNLVLGAFLTIFPIVGWTTSDALIGTWQTERGDTGGYLHVEFKACGDSVCGVILAAFNEQDERGDDYAHLGKSMVWDMKEKGNGRWSGGKIWDPVGDKTYKSKLKVEDDLLKVSGCVAFFCRSQQWNRVK